MMFFAGLVVGFIGATFAIALLESSKINELETELYMTKLNLERAEIRYKNLATSITAEVERVNALLDKGESI